MPPSSKKRKGYCKDAEHAEEDGKNKVNGR
jgi:hypothetical protein